MAKIGTRVGSENVAQNSVIGLDDIANVARQSNQKGHIRLKEDGGMQQIYGHTNTGFKSLFHRNNVDRQDKGTEMVARSVLSFAEGKGPAVMEKAKELLAPFVQNGQATQRMTNADVVRISEQIKGFAELGDTLKNAAKDIRTGNETQTFEALRSGFGDFVQAMKITGVDTKGLNELPEFSRNKAFAELRVGFMIGALDHLQKGGELSQSVKDSLNYLANPLGEPGGKTAFTGIFEDYKNKPIDQDGIDRLALAVGQHFMRPEAFKSAELRVEIGISHIESPVYVMDTEAQMNLFDLHKSGRGEPLDTLKSIFLQHLDAPPEPETYNPESGRIGTENQRQFVDNRG